MDRAETALVSGLTMIMVFGAIGYLLKRIVWDSKKRGCKRHRSG